jgi:hypothetical protein
VCIGMAGSMATILLAGGAKGKRYSLPHSTIHFHPAGGGMEGYAPDVERMVNELLRLQRVGSELLGRSRPRITASSTRFSISRPAKPGYRYLLIFAEIGRGRTRTNAELCCSSAFVHVVHIPLSDSTT